MIRFFWTNIFVPKSNVLSALCWKSTIEGIQILKAVFSKKLLFSSSLRLAYFAIFPHQLNNKVNLKHALSLISNVIHGENTRILGLTNHCKIITNIVVMYACLLCSVLCLEHSGRCINLFTIGRISTRDSNTLKIEHVTSFHNFSAVTDLNI